MKISCLERCGDLKHLGEYTVIVSHVDRMMCFDQSSVIVWIDSVRHTHIFDDDDDDDEDEDDDDDDDDDDD